MARDGIEETDIKIAIERGAAKTEKKAKMAKAMMEKEKAKQTVAAKTEERRATIAVAEDTSPESVRPKGMAITDRGREKACTM